MSAADRWNGTTPSIPQVDLANMIQHFEYHMDPYLTCFLLVVVLLALATSVASMCEFKKSKSPVHLLISIVCSAITGAFLGAVLATW